MNVYILILKSISLMIGLSAITATLLFYFQYKKPTALYYAGFLASFYLLMFGDWISYISLYYPEIHNTTSNIVLAIILNPVGIYFTFFALSFIFSLFGKKLYKSLKIIIVVYHVIVIPALYIYPNLFILGMLPIIFTTFYMLIYGLINIRDISDQILKKGVLRVLIISAIFSPTLLLFFFPQSHFIKSMILSLFFISVSVYSIFFGVAFFQRKPYLKGGNPTETFIKKFSITSREVELIQLILDGNSSKEIAENLSISPRTVTTHISNIYAKTKVKSRVQLMNLFSSNWAK